MASLVQTLASFSPGDLNKPLDEGYLGSGLKGYEMGVGIAAKQEQLRIQRAELEMKKQEYQSKIGDQDMDYLKQITSNSDNPAVQKALIREYSEWRTKFGKPVNTGLLSLLDKDEDLKRATDLTVKFYQESDPEKRILIAQQMDQIHSGTLKQAKDLSKNLIDSYSETKKFAVQQTVKNISDSVGETPEGALQKVKAVMPELPEEQQKALALSAYRNSLSTQKKINSEMTKNQGFNASARAKDDFDSSIKREKKRAGFISDVLNLAGDPELRRNLGSEEIAFKAKAILADPESSVRDAEYKIAEQSLGGDIVSQAKNYIRRLAQGKTLNDEQWRQLAQVMQSIGMQDQKKVKVVQSSFDNVVNRYGLDKDYVYSGVPSYQFDDRYKTQKQLKEAAPKGPKRKASQALVDEAIKRAGGNKDSALQQLSNLGYDTEGL